MKIFSPKASAPALLASASAPVTRLFTDASCVSNVQQWRGFFFTDFVFTFTSDDFGVPEPVGANIITFINLACLSASAVTYLSARVSSFTIPEITIIHLPKWEDFFFVGRIEGEMFLIQLLIEAVPGEKALQLPGTY